MPVASSAGVRRIFMHRFGTSSFVVAIASAALLAGCQTQRAAEKDRTEELERRVAELEKQVSPSPSSPDMVEKEPAHMAPPAVTASRPAPARPARSSQGARPAQVAV